MRNHKSLNRKLEVAFRIIFIAVIFCLLTLCACGGSGGGDEFIGAAIVNVNASPGEIDTGDRAQITIRINSVHENGIALKVLFPDGLEYVAETSFLTVGDVENDIGPAINMLADDGVYLVFYLAQSYFGDDGNSEGILTFELEAKDTVRNGLIEIDADVDDPTINNADEFDVNTPEFLAEDTTDINVAG